jgi:ATPase subunit of ABC transporter with duplicated ATPase domains
LLKRNQTVWSNARQLANELLTDSEVITRLARVGLGGDDRFKIVSHLSGGQRMRLALACLFAAGDLPDLLILDEPTNHLDLLSIEQLEARLKEFRGAILLVTHDQKFAEALACENLIIL